MGGESDKLVEIIPHEGYVEVRFLGAFSVARFRAQVDADVRACGEGSSCLLLIDYTALLPVPGVLERYEISTYAAQVLAPLEKVAAIGTSDQLKEKFGAQVARNRGLNVEAFVDREEGLRWLLEKD